MNFCFCVCLLPGFTPFQALAKPDRNRPVPTDRFRNQDCFVNGFDQFCAAVKEAASFTFWILPLGVIGNSLTKTYFLGTL